MVIPQHFLLFNDPQRSQSIHDSWVTVPCEVMPSDNLFFRAFARLISQCTFISDRFILFFSQCYYTWFSKMAMGIILPVADTASSDVTRNTIRQHTKHPSLQFAMLATAGRQKEFVGSTIFRPNTVTINLLLHFSLADHGDEIVLATSTCSNPKCPLKFGNI